MGLTNEKMTSLLAGEIIDKEIVDKVILDDMKAKGLVGKEMNLEYMKRTAESMLKGLGCNVNLEQEYRENEFLFEVDGAKFLTRGDIHTIGAKQKAGKSTLARIMMSSTINGQWNHLKCLLPKMEIVYVDTEMKAVDTQNSLRQIIKMSGMEEADASHIHMYNFRPLTPTEMKTNIRMLLEIHHPAMLVIDGVVDLCSDFNDVEASQDLVLNFLMKLAEEYNCAIVSVLHTNKTDKYTELRGHLGAFFEQKGVSVIKCVKDEKSNIVTVSVPTARYAPVPEWHFTYNEDGEPIDATTQYMHNQEDSAKAARERKEAERQELIRKRKDVILDIVKGNGGLILRKEAQERFKEKTELGDTAFKDLVKEMLEKEPIELYQGKVKNNALMLSIKPMEMNFG